MARRIVHTRRRILAAGLAAAAGVIARPVFAAPRVIRTRQVALRNVHTGDTLRASYWADDYYIPQSLRQIAYVLRDFHSGDIHPIDRRLLDLLARLQQMLNTNEPFMVTSGYRSPKTNARLAATNEGVAAHSLHMQGMAVDASLHSVSLRQLRMAATTLGGGGVGYYPASGFVHLDVGPIRHWEGDA
jgi:uncharacterized protein YcbK (DUF882 family)